MIGALCRGRKRGNAVKGNVEYRSRAAARICRESPLTEWSATLAREGNGRPFPSAPRRVRGLVRRGQRPLPAIGFWGCRPAALFFQKGRRGLGNRCRHRSGECERTEVADFELSEFFNRIASAEGKAWVLSVERVGDVGDSALVEPDGDELVSQLGKRRWRVMGDPEDGWWVEVDSDGNELPGDWEYDRKGGYVYCAFA